MANSTKAYLWRGEAQPWPPGAYHGPPYHGPAATFNLFTVPCKALGIHVVVIESEDESGAHYYLHEGANKPVKRLSDGQNLPLVPVPDCPFNLIGIHKTSCLGAIAIDVEELGSFAWPHFKWKIQPRAQKFLTTGSHLAQNGRIIDRRFTPLAHYKIPSNNERQYQESAPQLPLNKSVNASILGRSPAGVVPSQSSGGLVIANTMARSVERESSPMSPSFDASAATSRGSRSPPLSDATGSPQITTRDAEFGPPSQIARSPKTLGTLTDLAPPMEGPEITTSSQTLVNPARNKDAIPPPSKCTHRSEVSQESQSSKSEMRTADIMDEAPSAAPRASMPKSHTTNWNDNNMFTIETPSPSKFPIPKLALDVNDNGKASLVNAKPKPRPAKGSAQAAIAKIARRIVRDVEASADEVEPHLATRGPDSQSSSRGSKRLAREDTDFKPDPAHDTDEDDEEVYVRPARKKARRALSNSEVSFFQMPSQSKPKTLRAYSTEQSQRVGLARSERDRTKARQNADPVVSDAPPAPQSFFDFSGGEDDDREGDVLNMDTEANRARQLDAAIARVDDVVDPTVVTRYQRSRESSVQISRAPLEMPQGRAHDNQEMTRVTNLENEIESVMRQLCQQQKKVGQVSRANRLVEKVKVTQICQQLTRLREQLKTFSSSVTLSDPRKARFVHGLTRMEQKNGHVPDRALEEIAGLSKKISWYDEEICTTQNDADRNKAQRIVKRYKKEIAHIQATLICGKSLLNRPKKYTRSTTEVQNMIKVETTNLAQQKTKSHQSRVRNKIQSLRVELRWLETRFHGDTSDSDNESDADEAGENIIGDASSAPPAEKHKRAALKLHADEGIKRIASAMTYSLAATLSGKRKVSQLSSSSSSEAFPSPKRTREEHSKSLDSGMRTVRRRDDATERKCQEIFGFLEDQPQSLPQPASPIRAPTENSRDQSSKPRDLLALERERYPVNEAEVAQPAPDKPVNRERSNKDQVVQQAPSSATPAGEPKGSIITKGIARPIPEAIRRSSRMTKPVRRFGDEWPSESGSENDIADFVVEDGSVLVSNLPDVPPKDPNMWVPAGAAMAKPAPFLKEYVYNNGTKTPGNSFEELWTIPEQEHLIFLVQKKSAVLSCTWEPLTWQEVKRNFNNYFKGVVQAVGTKLAEPYQMEGMTTLWRDRVFVSRSWKDLKDRATVIRELIDPKYVKQSLKPPQKPEEKPPAQRSRSDSASSALSSIISPEVENHSPPKKAATAESDKWRVDDPHRAPDHMKQRPKLKRPQFNGPRSEAFAARFVEGGPCFVCKKTESCDKWHTSLYMKVPVVKKKGRAKKGDDEDDDVPFGRLQKEYYEVYCSECFQLDYLQRLQPGGPCDQCGKSKSCDEWHHNFFLDEPGKSRYCSSCYIEDYEDRRQTMGDWCWDKRMMWHGVMVDYGEGKAEVPAKDNGDVDDALDDDTLIGPDDSLNGDLNGVPDVEEGEIREPAQGEGDTNATIDDETIADSDNSFAEKSQASVQGELRFSSPPDDHSSSPRLARRRPAANHVSAMSP